MTIERKQAHDEAIYLIRNYTDNWQYDVARGCAEMAHGIGIITDKEYDLAIGRIEKKKDVYTFARMRKPG